MLTLLKIFSYFLMLCRMIMWVLRDDSVARCLYSQEFFNYVCFYALFFICKCKMKQKCPIFYCSINNGIFVGESCTGIREWLRWYAVAGSVLCKIWNVVLRQHLNYWIVSHTIKQSMMSYVNSHIMRRKFMRNPSLFRYKFPNFK